MPKRGTKEYYNKRREVLYHESLSTSLKQI